MLGQNRNTRDIRLLSVVIPAYQAEKFIQRTLINVMNVLDQTRYKYEIICVVDGNIDETFNKARKIAKRYPKKIFVVGYNENLGKGHAVRYGMAKARGDVIGFIDAGIEINPNGISMLLEHMEWYKADIMVGSKRHPASKVIYPWQRRFISLGGQLIIKILFNLNVRDTQVGLKFFRREVLKEVLPRLLVKDFAFDIEILTVSKYLGFKRIYEAPIEIKMNFSGGTSTIFSKGFIRTLLKTLWDTLAVFYRLRIRRYYEYKNRRNWITPEYLIFNKQ